jgi:hypothetical protein
MDEVCGFYRQHFESACVKREEALIGAERLAGRLVEEKPRAVRDHWQKCSLELLRGVILHLSYEAYRRGDERVTLPGLISFLGAVPIESSWRQMMLFPHDDDVIRDIVVDTAKWMLEGPRQEIGSILATTRSYLFRAV